MWAPSFFFLLLFHQKRWIQFETVPVYQGLFYELYRSIFSLSFLT